MPDLAFPTIHERARAKINLALHVTGQRDDGYHLLESLVTFADWGDRLDFTPSASDSFSLSGRFAALLSQDPSGQGGNLVLKARDMLRAAVHASGREAGPVQIHLEKNLPVASGIGGGSADAAAALRGLLRVWNVPSGSIDLDALAIRLGADVPMCLASQPLIALGIGETIEPVPDLPSFALVLANPLKAVSTPEVFRALHSKANGTLAISPAPQSATEWLAAISRLRNDLEPPARTLVGEIAEISDLLRSQGASFVRMSGSGATCFGVYDSIDDAHAAQATLLTIRPDWYFEATTTVSGSLPCRA